MLSAMPPGGTPSQTDDPNTGPSTSYWSTNFQTGNQPLQGQAAMPRPQRQDRADAPTQSARVAGNQTGQLGQSGRTTYSEAANSEAAAGIWKGEPASKPRTGPGETAIGAHSGQPDYGGSQSAPVKPATVFEHRHPVPPRSALNPGGDYGRFAPVPGQVPNSAPRNFQNSHNFQNQNTAYSTAYKRNSELNSDMRAVSNSMPRFRPHPRSQTTQQSGQQRATNSIAGERRNAGTPPVVSIDLTSEPPVVNPKRDPERELTREELTQLHRSRLRNIHAGQASSSQPPHNPWLSNWENHESTARMKAGLNQNPNNQGPKAGISEGKGQTTDVCMGRGQCGESGGYVRRGASGASGVRGARGNMQGGTLRGGRGDLKPSGGRGGLKRNARNMGGRGYLYPDTTVYIGQNKNLIRNLMRPPIQPTTHNAHSTVPTKPSAAKPKISVKQKKDLPPSHAGQQQQQQISQQSRHPADTHSKPDLQTPLVGTASASATGSTPNTPQTLNVAQSAASQTQSQQQHPKPNVTANVPPSLTESLPESLPESMPADMLPKAHDKKNECDAVGKTMKNKCIDNSMHEDALDVEPGTKANNAESVHSVHVDTNPEIVHNHVLSESVASGVENVHMLSDSVVKQISNDHTNVDAGVAMEVMPVEVNLGGNVQAVDGNVDGIKHDNINADEDAVKNNENVAEPAEQGGGGGSSDKAILDSSPEAGGPVSHGQGATPRTLVRNSIQIRIIEAEAEVPPPETPTEQAPSRTPEEGKSNNQQMKNFDTGKVKADCLADKPIIADDKTSGTALAKQVPASRTDNTASNNAEVARVSDKKCQPGMTSPPITVTRDRGRSLIKQPHNKQLKGKPGIPRRSRATSQSEMGRRSVSRPTPRSRPASQSRVGSLQKSGTVHDSKMKTKHTLISSFLLPVFKTPPACVNVGGGEGRGGVGDENGNENDYEDVHVVKGNVVKVVNDTNEGVHEENVSSIENVTSVMHIPHELGGIDIGMNGSKKECISTNTQIPVSRRVLRSSTRTGGNQSAK